MNHHRDGYESITWKQDLEGYFRDPEFDQNTVQDSGKSKISWQETGFDCYPGSGLHRNLGRRIWDFIPSLSRTGSHDDSNTRSSFPSRSLLAPFSGYFIALTTLPFQKKNRVHRLAITFKNMDEDRDRTRFLGYRVHPGIIYWLPS